MTGKSFHANIVVRIGGDPLVEGRIQSAISRGGAAIDRVTRRVSPNGTWEHEIVIVFERFRSLDEIVLILGEVRGVAVTAVTLLPSGMDCDRTKEAR